MQKLREAPERLKKRARSITSQNENRCCPATEKESFEDAVTKEGSIELAIERHPELYRQYCAELVNPAPAAPGTDPAPAARSNGTDPAGETLAKHMRAGGKLDSSAPGYREWIDSFRRPE